MTTEQKPINVFLGQIHPERADVNIKIPKIQITVDEKHIAEADIFILKSQIVVRITGNMGQDILTTKNLIQGMISLLTDALGWSNGCGYAVEIIGHTSTNTTEEPSIFGIGIPALE